MVAEAENAIVTRLFVEGDDDLEGHLNRVKVAEFLGFVKPKFCDCLRQLNWTREIVCAHLL